MRLIVGFTSGRARKYDSEPKIAPLAMTKCPLPTSGTVKVGKCNFGAKYGLVEFDSQFTTLTLGPEN